MRSIVSKEREDEFSVPTNKYEVRAMRLCAELLRRHGGATTGALEQATEVETRIQELETLRI